MARRNKRSPAKKRELPPHVLTRHSYGRQWASDPKSRNAIDTYDPLRMPWAASVTESDIADLKLQTDLAIPEALHSTFISKFECALTFIVVHQHEAGEPPPHEIRDRMEAIRADAQRLLERLGVDAGYANSEDWEPTSLHFNGTVLARLVDAANEDRSLIIACVKAIGALLNYADTAREKAQAQVNDAPAASVKKLAFARALAAMFQEMFGEPTETANGPWHKFATWAYARAGVPIGTNVPRDLLRKIKKMKET